MLLNFISRLRLPLPRDHGLKAIRRYWYSPFTSADPYLSICGSAHSSAKDMRTRQLPCSYAAFKSLTACSMPGLWREDGRKGFNKLRPLCLLDLRRNLPEAYH